jgi:hypothetical protein
MARSRGSKEPRKKGRSLPARARAVMKAFRVANFSAPRFMSSCGIFPEVSESASDNLHKIVHELATRQLNQGRHVRALRKGIHRLAETAPNGKRSNDKLIERISDDLTAVLAAEATAAYLFGLSVGLTVRSLPERLDL